MKRQGWNRGSFTIEGAIMVPLFIFTIMSTLRIGIGFFQASATREVYEELEQLDIVQEFYNYQIVGEMGEKIFDD